VTGGWSGDVRLWDTNSGEERPSHMKSTSRIMAMAFSPDDPDLLAATGGDRSIHLWDVVTQKERARLHGAVDQLNVLAFSPDGQTIATGSNSDPITLWNAAQRKADILTVSTEHRNCVLGYTEDGKRLVTMDATGRVMHRDATSFAVLDTILQVDLKSAFVADATFTAAAIAVSKDMKSLALGMMDGTVAVWNLETQSNISFKTHPTPVRGVAFSPDSNQLITAGNHVAKGEDGEVLLKEDGEVRLAKDGELRLWNLAAQSLVASAQLDDVPDSVWAVCLRFSPNGETIAVGSGPQLSVFHRKDLRRVHLSGDLGAFLSLRFSPDGRYLASGHGPGRPRLLVVWDTRNWSPRFLTGLEYVPPDIAFSPDGSRMVSGGDRLIVWDTDTWQELARYKPPLHDVSFIKFSPDGNDLVTSDADALRVWRASSFEEIDDHEARLGRWGTEASPVRK
jgi:WD40 repeat protein